MNENIRLKEQLSNLEVTLDEFYQEQGENNNVANQLQTKNKELEEIIENMKKELEIKLNKRNEIKDRNDEFLMKNELLEKKIVELQNLNQG